MTLLCDTIKVAAVEYGAKATKPKNAGAGRRPTSTPAKEAVSVIPPTTPRVINLSHATGREEQPRVTTVSTGPLSEFSLENHLLESRRSSRILESESVLEGILEVGL